MVQNTKLSDQSSLDSRLLFMEDRDRVLRGGFHLIADVLFLIRKAIVDGRTNRLQFHKVQNEVCS